MWPPKHFVISVALSIIVIAAGTIGYQSIEGWNFLDSIYMTIITIATSATRKSMNWETPARSSPSS